MDGRAHLRTESGWRQFDQLALTLAALGVLLLTMLPYWGYGPRSYKSCPNRGTITKPEEIRVDTPKVAPPPVVALPEVKPAPQAEVVPETKVAAPVIEPSPPVPTPPAAMPHPVVEGPAPTITVGEPGATLASGTGLAAIEASLHAAKTGKQVSLAGIVPSAEIKSSLVSSVQRALGNGGAVVIDRLVVDNSVAPSSWLGSGAEVVKLLQQMRGPAAVDVTGQDVRLTGIVSESTDKEIVGLKAVEIFGSDSKLQNLVTTRPLADPVVEIDTTGGHAVVTGKVGSDDTYASLMQSVTTVFGVGNVTDRLAVDEDISAIKWQSSAQQVATELAQLKLPGGVLVKNDKAVLTGMADSESEKSARGVAMQKLLGSSFVIENQITVRELSIPVVDLQNTDGKLTISGQVGDEATKAIVVTAANTAFGAANVTDRLTLGQATGPIDWSGTAGQVTEQVLSFKQSGGIRITGTNVTLTGVVASEAERDARQTAAKALLGTAVQIDNQIRVVVPEPAPQPQSEPPPVPVTPPQPEPKVAEAPPPVPVVDCKQIAAGAVVEFATNKADLTDRGRAVLDQVFACLKDARYEVGGHTDSTGKNAWNIQLSLMRAKAAVTYLVSKGIETSRLEAKGLGSSQPVTSNATPDGRAKNRRITFTSKS
jgi:OmpA-OmpF porin, OOP family